MKQSWKAPFLIAGILALIAVLVRSNIAVPTPVSDPAGLREKDVAIHIDGQHSVEGMLMHTEAISKSYDDVGKFWSTVLDDEAINGRSRAYAAKMLGTMRYPPAIPVLIKHVGLIDSRHGYTDGMGEDEFSRVRKELERYGNAAIPDIVDAYLESTDQWQRSQLLLAIATGKPRRVARTYLHGLHALGDNRITVKDLELFADSKSPRHLGGLGIAP